MADRKRNAGGRRTMNGYSGRQLLVGLGAVATLLLSACSSSTQSAAPGQGAGGGAAAPTTNSAPVILAAPVTVPSLTSSSQSAASTGTSIDSSVSTSPTTSTPPPIPPVAWALSPTAGAADVNPTAPISVTVTDGTLVSAMLTTPEGSSVEGALAADGLSWMSTVPLGYGKTYTVAAVAADATGVQTLQNYTFTTLTPDNKTLATAFPTDGLTVGVGQPVAIFFDEPIADKAGVEQMISIKTTPEVVGAFYWTSNKEVHWRPQSYWPAGTAVEVSVNIYGKDVGNGIYGQADKKFAFAIGQSKIATIDDNTKTMVITIDGAVVKQMPVSLGTNQYPTYNGVHVVAEAYESKIMDSSTWGLTGVGAYRTDVAYATRISSSGEFVHAAPWSVWAQGSENVSHGCVNVSTEDAIWFYENFGYGDIVDIQNTVGPPLQVWDGYGDWTVPWETYSLGGARN